MKIKIIYENSLYGFTKDTKFISIVDLIDYHRTRSMMEYNDALEVMLLYPISRNSDQKASNEQSKDELIQQFVNIANDLKILQQRFEELSNEIKEIESEISFKRQAQDAFKEAEDMFKQQIEMHKIFQKEAEPHEVSEYVEHSNYLNANLTKLKELKILLETDLGEQRWCHNNLEKEISKLKSEINSLLLQKKHFENLMISENLSEDLINRIAEDGIEPWKNQVIIEEKYSEKKWFFKKFTRENAERALKDAPTGTFLIRSAKAGGYALSIAANDTVYHCVIYESEKGTFGLAEPYNIFKTLKELVIHYSTNSLEEHNETLQTTLLHPVICLRNTENERKRDSFEMDS